MSISFMSTTKEYRFLIQMKGCLGVYLPVGELSEGGTCEFASEKCKRYCSAKAMQIASRLSKEQRQFIKLPNKTDICHAIDHYPSREDQERVYKLIKEEKPEDVAFAFLHDLQKGNEWILHWFASGDCPKALTEKISHIMGLINLSGYIQNGFTRNFDLTYRVRISMDYPFKDLIRLWHTAERKIGGTTYTAIPDYDTGITKLWYIRDIPSGGCGPSTYSYKNIERASNCTECLVRRQGCFYKFQIPSYRGKLLKEYEATN